MLRARDLGIPFEGMPGSLNAITDVRDVQVGHTTLVSGEGELRVGKGPVRLSPGTGSTRLCLLRAMEAILLRWRPLLPH